MTETGTKQPKLPPPWFIHTFWRVHRAVHRLSGGRFLWEPGGRQGWGAMRLTTTGHRSGKERTVIIAYLEDGDDLLGMAMNGWDEGHPAWRFSHHAGWPSSQPFMAMPSRSSPSSR